MSKNIDLRSLDFNNSGAWPTQVKLGACVLLMALIIGLGWYLFVSDRRVTLEKEEATEVQLREEFQGKQGRAANLEPLKQQLAQMEVMLQQMLRQLPSKNEMPDLIVDISQTALAAGISNELFQPGSESQREFYAEKPIQLRMVGSYHQFGAFVSGVASLPRVVIMTMHDISLQPRDGKDGTLVLSGTVKTYRYLDEEEESQDSNTAGGSK
ncbi:type 4a pilus biogenesis protein PilO [uncultured Arenimonas sp.]|uniref:type 4a pilus biogenesis protein PilO n=1 Tax=uncultured Arenimonas sp. TaxID=546226 RepID=UPI0030D6FA71